MLLLLGDRLLLMDNDVILGNSDDILNTFTKYMQEMISI